MCMAMAVLGEVLTMRNSHGIAEANSVDYSSQTAIMRTPSCLKVMGVVNKWELVAEHI